MLQTTPNSSRSIPGIWQVENKALWLLLFLCRADCHTISCDFFIGIPGVDYAGHGYENPKREKVAVPTPRASPWGVVV